MPAQPRSRRLVLFNRPQAHAFHHPTILVVEPDDVFGDQPDGLNPIELKPLAVTIVMADLEIEKDIPLSGDFDFRIIPAPFTDPRK
jgi:hypothetical protein